MIPPLQVPTLPVTRRDASRNLPWLQQFIKKWELSANRNDISRLLPLSPLGFGRYNSGGVTMPGLVRTLFALAAVGAVIAVPAGSIAAAQPAIPSPTAHQASAAAATNPWLALSAMTSSSGAASAAATQGDVSIGPPPAAPLTVILGTIALAVWILTQDNDGHYDLSGEPISP